MAGYNLEKDFTDKQNQILKAITVQEINALAKKQLPYTKMNILVVGDKAAVWDGLMKLGYEVIELDVDGNVISTDKKVEKGTEEAPPTNGKTPYKKELKDTKMK